MATRVAWLLNLDADLELASPTGYRASGLSKERVRELCARMADLVAVDDIVLDDDFRGPLPQDTIVQCFCPMPSALARIAALALTVPAAPPLAVLQQVNDRAFCAELGHGLPGSGFARDLKALEEQLQQPSPTGCYVIKRAFSFAGREQRRVYDGVLDDSTRGFCLRSFAQGHGVQVEPWVERLADFARYGYITRAGELLIGPVREQRCDPLGRFLGMSTEAPQITDAEDTLLAATATQTGKALAVAGYFGPFGSDGFRYRTPNGIDSCNPRCEINARFTMGYPRALLLAGLAHELRARE